jgi:DHA1 family multidrug resistance protein-like MFS transporter
MADLIREAPFGQLVRLITGNKLFRYPEEKDDFTCPSSYKDDNRSQQAKEINEKEIGAAGAQDDEPDLTQIETQQEEVDLEKAETNSSSDGSTNINRTATLGLQRTQTTPFSAERVAVEAALAVEKTKSRPILPARTADNIILADWYVRNYL